MSSRPKLVLRYPNDGLEAIISDKTGLKCEDPSLTQQDDSDANNPNNVMAQFARTGDMSILEKSNPQYSDFIGMPADYHTAHNIVLAAQDAFFSLPASIRTKFDNDPGKYADFVADPKNHEEMLNLGMLKPEAKSKLEDLSPLAEAPHGTQAARGGKSAGKQPNPVPKAPKADQNADPD